MTTLTEECMSMGLGMMGGGRAADDSRLKTEVLREEDGRERGGGALTVHAVAGWEGAPHNSQEREAQAAKIRQYSLE